MSTRCVTREFLRAQIWRSPLACPSFAIYIGDQVDAELFITGVNSAYYTGDFTYTNFLSTRKLKGEAVVNFLVVACGVLVDTQAQWLASQPLLLAEMATQPSKDTRAESTMARCEISLIAFCSRFRLRRRQSWMTGSVLVSGLGRPRGVMIT